MLLTGLQGEAVVWGSFLSLCLLFGSSWRACPQSSAQLCSAGRRLQAGQRIPGHREVATGQGLPERLLLGASVLSGLHAFMHMSRESGQVVPLTPHFPEDQGWPALELDIFPKCSGMGVSLWWVQKLKMSWHEPCPDEPVE